MSMGTRFIGLLLALAASPALAGNLTIVEKVSGDGELNVATFFVAKDDQHDNPVKVGLLGIVIPGTRRISIAFSAAEWPVLSALWTKAVAAQSNSWQTIGTFNETGTEDPSVLTMSAGQGVQIVISSPALGARTFVVSPSELNRLTAAFQRAQASLDNQTSE
jgi:hypothetical protein